MTKYAIQYTDRGQLLTFGPYTRAQAEENRLYLYGQGYKIVDIVEFGEEVNK